MSDANGVPNGVPLAAAFVVQMDQRGNVGIQAPLHDIPLCLELLAAAQRTLAKYLFEQKAASGQQPAAPPVQLYLPDGSQAPPTGN